MKQTPILFLGDAPSVPGGLSRIGRDLAVVASKMEEFRVGFLGRGGLPSMRYPFIQYNFPESDQWGEGWLQSVWHDFAGSEEGVVFTIWDPSRLMWFGNPQLPELAWLREAPFKKWGYFPIDHEGPGGKLSVMSAEALRGYDRILAYGMFGGGVISKTLDYKQAVEWMPHGINMDTFQPRDGTGVRAGLGLSDDTVVVGVVMTNQERKDWGLTFEIIKILKSNFKKLLVWCKTDSIDRHWDLRALAVDFGVQDVVMIDLDNLSDNRMSYMYSMCNVTMLPSLGEGFGYPIAESMACGVPCVHGNYGGGSELIPTPDWVAYPIGYRYDTRHNCKRPIYNAAEWAGIVMSVVDRGPQAELCRSSVEHLNWPNLHTVWERWFREGLL